LGHDALVKAGAQKAKSKAIAPMTAMVSPKRQQRERQLLAIGG
jgi:hypothetical protein